MLTSDDVIRIRKMLGRGISRLEIADTVGCSRSLVDKVANGQRGLVTKYEVKRKKIADAERRAPVYEKCPGCGHIVSMPCLECMIETGERVKRIVRLNAGKA